MSAADDKANAFSRALPNPDDPTRRERLWARLGVTVMAVGMVVALIAVVLSQASDNPLDQNTQLTLGIAGVAAVCLGGIVFLRYSIGRLLRWWLLRILDELHRRP